MRGSRALVNFPLKLEWKLSTESLLERIKVEQRNNKKLSFKLTIVVAPKFRNKNKSNSNQLYKKKLQLLWAEKMKRLVQDLNPGTSSVRKARAPLAIEEGLFKPNKTNL